MPWNPGDSARHTKKAKSAKQQAKWAAVANDVLARTGDEAHAIRAANAVIGGIKKHKGKYRKPNPFLGE